MKKKRSFDLEQWLRAQVGQDDKVTVGENRTLVDQTGTTVGNFGDGGAIAGKCGTDSIARFSVYPGVVFESVTHHHWKQATIVHLLCRIEEEHGNPTELRLYSMLSCALHHDLSEVVGTDVNYHVKNRDLHSRAQHAMRDRVAHDQVVAGLRPEWRSYFPHPIDINAAFPVIEQKFWQASEYVGYSLFMLEEIARGKICKEFIVRFHNDVAVYLDKLEKLSDTFVSVKVLRDTELLPKWQRLARTVERAKK